MDITTGQLVLIFLFAVSVALSLLFVLSAPAEPRNVVDGKWRELPAQEHIDYNA